MWLVISFVLIGATALIAQTVLVRELLVVFQGNELCLGIIFGVWLMGITLGATLASFLTDRFKKQTTLFNFFLGVLVSMTISLPVLVYFIRIIRWYIPSPAGQPIPFLQMLIVSFILIIPYSIFIGLIFPLACKVYTAIRHQEEPAVVIGWVYIYEALGSLLGGVVFTFLLVDYLNAFAIILLLDWLILLVTFIIAGQFRMRIIQVASVILLVVVLGGIFIWQDKLHWTSIENRWASFKPAETFLESIDSRYENLSITKLQDQYQLYGNGQLVAVFPNEVEHEKLAHFFLTEHPAPETVLLIGGGAEGLLEPILKHPTVHSLHYVQIDPKMMEILTKYLPDKDRRAIAKNSETGRLSIHYVDGRYFVKHTPDRFDMIILNLPDPATSLLNRFYTREFFEELKKILKPSGVVVTGVSSAVNYFGETVGNYTGSVYDTLTAVFKNVLVTPGDHGYFFAADQTDVITFDTNELDRRFRTRHISSDKIPAEYFKPLMDILLEEWHIRLTREALEQRKKSFLNTDIQPISYFFNLLLWDTVMSDFGNKPSTFFRVLKDLKFWWLIIALAGLLVIRLIYARLTPQRALQHQRFNTLYVIFAIGFAGLALELVLLFAFQNIYGYLYGMVGFVVAMFMLGLALGGIVSNRIIMRQSHKWTRILLIIMLGVVIFTGLVPWLVELISWTGAVAVFMLLITASGILTGLVYPIVNKLYLDSGIAIGKTAGLIDSADHLGACAGALFTGVVFMPLFGIWQTCILVALVNLVGVILLVLQVSKSTS